MLKKKTKLLPNGFQVRIFKGKARKGSHRGYGQLLHSPLVDGEGTGLCCVTVLNIIINSQAVASLRAMCCGHRVVNVFHLIGVLVSVKKKKSKKTQEYASDTIVCVLQVGTKDSLTAIWLIYCLNCYRVSWLYCYFCHHMLTSFQLLILEPGFCDSEENWDTTAFLQTRDRQRTWWEGSVLGRPDGVCLVAVGMNSMDLVHASMTLMVL